MKHLISMLVTALTVATLNAAVSSGDRVVIDDFEYVILSSLDYSLLTQNVEKVCRAWSKMNGNEEGRVALHGRRGHATVTNGQTFVEYADGYIHCESNKANRIRSQRLGTPKPPKPQRPKTAYELKRERIYAMRRAAASKTNEVTITVGGAK